MCAKLNKMMLGFIALLTTIKTSNKKKGRQDCNENGPSVET